MTSNPSPPGQEATPIVVFDVDGVVIYYGGVEAQATPGIQRIFDLLTCLGFQIHMWSAGGADYCRTIAEKHQLHGACIHYHDKPSYPPTEEEALAILGARPVMQIDDDPTERVADWPFFQYDWPAMKVLP